MNTFCSFQIESIKENIIRSVDRYLEDTVIWGDQNGVVDDDFGRHARDNLSKYPRASKDCIAFTTQVKRIEAVLRKVDREVKGLSILETFVNLLQLSSCN